MFTEMCLPLSTLQSLKGRWKSHFSKNWNVGFLPVKKKISNKRIFSSTLCVFYIIYAKKTFSMFYNYWTVQSRMLTSKQDVVPLVDWYMGCFTDMTHLPSHFWQALFMIEIYKLIQSSDNWNWHCCMINETHIKIV